jgi:uncharacterized protein YbaR (Trm112 family)/SAM-dependent methyltransferase
MHTSLLEILRCPFCGTRLTVVDNDALVLEDDHVESGVLGCECCAFPVVSGIPILIADDATREAMHALEGGDKARALHLALGLDGDRAEAFGELFGRHAATYRDALAVLSPDAEGTYFLYRFSDPTFVMAQTILEGIGQNRQVLEGRALDLCGGSGHLTRVLDGLRPAEGTVVADVFFWKLWLARRFTAPSSHQVCCDANNPLPFDRGTFSLVVLSDAFPYIWHKRMLADDMMRVAGPGGTIVMPHLHSALGENFSAGMTLTPAAYRDLFGPHHPRLFRDSTLLDQALTRGAVDLSHDVPATLFGGGPSLTLVASRIGSLFRTYEPAVSTVVSGELRVNPLYRIERRDSTLALALTFPTPEYEEEFQECKRYLPDAIELPVDATAPLTPKALGERYAELRRRRIVIDTPRRYY